MLTIPYLLNKSIHQHRDHIALSFVDGGEVTYGDLEKKIQETTQMLSSLGIMKNDKVAILSQNMPQWGVSYFSILSLGAVAVPLLPDFSPVEIQNILQHSEAKVVFVSDNLSGKVQVEQIESLHTIIAIEGNEITQTNIKNKQEKVTLNEIKIHESDLATIIYTSGTTGKSKGVMLSHKNLCANTIQGGKIQPMSTKDRLLSILPLSHTYENTLGFLLPMFNGSAVYYLKKLPTPSVLLPALEKIRPTIMLSVPLVIEKVFYNRVLPTIRKNPIVKHLYKLPIFRKLIHRSAGKKLMETFGGKLIFFGVGGAKLNKMVERFLKEGRFPYAIGYGLTETAPLLAGMAPGVGVLQSTGPIVEDVDIKIDAANPKTGEGEIWAKGPNVMMGYYKEPELTKEVLTDEGWFKTGDLGVFNKKGFLFIKGRSKNVIIGASGENIYPEEIESVINNFRFVVESLVVEKKGKLVAMVYFNKEELEKQYKILKDEWEHKKEDWDAKMDELGQELKAYLNARVNKFSQIQLVIAQSDPFQKTATQKIKRFLYT